MTVPSNSPDFVREISRLREQIGVLEAQAARDELANAPLRKLEWLLAATSASGTSQPAHRPQPYGNLLPLNTSRRIADSVDEQVITGVVDDYLHLLETSAAVYETNGDYALGIFSSGWCRFMDESSRSLCGTTDNRAALDGGRWHCHESCWATSRASIETGEPVDLPCHGGINIYAIPIRAGGEIVGSINFGYGDPPRDPEKLAELAERYQVPVEELRRQAESYESRPRFLIELAKERLRTSARLLGSIMEHRDAERELERVGAELARSNADLEQFAYVASHDLQEPLRMVSGFVQLLADRYRGRLDADADEFIGYATEGAARMQRLIDDLLAYSRITTRQEPLVLIPAEQPLREALAGLEPAIALCHAVVTHDLLPRVRANPAQLSRVFVNLLGNALKFQRGENPRVHVGVRREGSEWVFSVSDSGIGIEPQYFERIFVMFQRLHGRTEYPGTGMGLAIVKRIIERHHGRIWVESEPGRGSTFNFTLQVAE